MEEQMSVRLWVLWVTLAVVLTTWAPIAALARPVAPGGMV
jgi:hypothetical protein